LVARKFTEYHGPTLQYDLSNIQHMINAAEPVDYDAIMNFYDIFSRFGLPHNVVIPTYGLAEHTVFVCSGGLQALTVPKSCLEKGMIEIVHQEELVFDAAHATRAKVVTSDQQTIVGCGFPFRGENIQLFIVDRETSKVLPELSVGEVWVASPSKATGYWGLPELSEHDFHAQLNTTMSTDESQSKEVEEEKKIDVSGDFLRTGDLGFMYQGELFICGRIKDLIIIGGSNHYPQDIEHSVEQCVGDYLRAGCSAAFSLRSESNHTEDIAYVAEVSLCYLSNIVVVTTLLNLTRSKKVLRPQTLKVLLRNAANAQPMSMVLGYLLCAYCKQGQFQRPLQARSLVHGANEVSLKEVFPLFFVLTKK
jgi:acyl-CoA synthetase (AMP-forming)/AMP-acid ligase II